MNYQDHTYILFINFGIYKELYQSIVNKMKKHRNMFEMKKTKLNLRGKKNLSEMQMTNLLRL